MSIFGESSTRNRPSNEQRKVGRRLGAVTLVLAALVGSSSCGAHDTAPNPPVTRTAKGNAAPDMLPKCTGVKVIYKGEDTIKATPEVQNATDPGIYDTVASVDFGDGSHEDVSDGLSAKHTYADLHHKEIYSLIATVAIVLPDGTTARGGFPCPPRTVTIDSRP